MPPKKSQVIAGEVPLHATRFGSVRNWNENESSVVWSDRTLRGTANCENANLGTLDCENGPVRSLFPADQFFA